MFLLDPDESVIGPQKGCKPQIENNWPREKTNSLSIPSSSSDYMALASSSPMGLFSWASYTKCLQLSFDSTL